ncbi:carboxypeptidase-like regulatory domain-containing protein [Fibrisoma montanum]|uniref:Carboxypeptidase-like regulatory domain-containing protein n=1 Tax=Fibrisoma montanum TaxID=2305895 RepID=A0A418M201_9BACT|nr:DUF5686 and carboxypeptidase-like regulatory domain-containing protein [Fibrisoma montanum]RIV19696.1 carboxypeptidase-like regulatory domain-containing protein [Fibrisoma montanum]
MKHACFILFLFSFWLGIALPAQSQLTVTGRITEAATGQPIPFANVAVAGKPIGTQADPDGRYQLILRQPADTLLVSAMGFQAAKLAIDPTKPTQTVDISLAAATATLGEVTVRAGENPAYRVLRLVNDRRKQNDYRRANAYEYQAYSQLAISITDMARPFRERRAVRAVLDALKQKQAPGTVVPDSAMVLPVFMSESVSKLYGRREPQRQKEHILKTNINSVGLTDDSFVALFTGAGFSTINFYQNAVGIFNKEFMSPLADNGRGAYRYFLADTAQIGQHTCFGIDFDPRNPRDLVMQGRVWIDTVSYALVQIDATIGPQANLNYINQVQIEQSYELLGDSLKAWLPERTHVVVSVGEVVKNTFGATVDYLTTVQEAVVGQPKPAGFYEPEIETAEDRNESSDQYWQTARQHSLGADSTRNVAFQAMLDTVRSVPLVKAYTRAAAFLSNGGFLSVGKSVQVGSLFSGWAYNNIEGHRLRIGARTTNLFSRRWLLAGYVAYGTRDKVWKSGWEVHYIPTRKPLTMISLRSSYDLEQLGLRTEDVADNPFLTYVNRFGHWPRAYYQEETSLSVQRDVARAFTQTIGVRERTFRPTFPFAFRMPVDDTTLPTPSVGYVTDEVFLETRYAPGRLPSRRVNSRRIRRRAGETAPIVTLRYTHGWYHPDNNRAQVASYDKWQFDWSHQLRWGVLGRMQYTVQAGYTPSAVPYPLLQVHLGNPTPVYNRNAYNLMNPAEFVSDRYVSVAAEHKFEGALTNRLPLIRRWNWRTFVEGKVLWGSLSAQNRRILAAYDPAGQPIAPIRSLGSPAGRNVPYVEVGYGVENVFRLLRIEALHRLTYRDVPQATTFAVKVSAQVGL